ncbi:MULTISPECIES: hydrogenase maturation nickel metallochaperone HypA [Methylococcus]|uniref:Hydrogenase maturation factor HypA n=1 Tax=Methylococcus capsulatus TaxID=414 RepID=A0ABZ2F494_METCP|nr:MULTISPECIES: hydrogenase maturation nickel metallochaperone HypA [Methylococcus]MDF9391713.1 hydrogenase maturation nickel metallochaperone HypA [Methylococcus capsulatus]
MHELSVCMELIEQVESIARSHDAERVESLVLRIGVLSGVEPGLLERAFEIARLGTVAEHASLRTERIEPRIRCRACGLEADAGPSDLRCPACFDTDTMLIAGDEMILARVELLQAAD